MSLSTSRKFFLGAIVLAALAGCVLGGALSGSTGVNYSDPTSVDSGGAVIGLLLVLISMVLEIVAWIGALVKTAQLARWGWFACMLIPFINGFAFLGYLLFGPTESARPYQSKYPSPYQAPAQPAPYQQPPYSQPSDGQPPYGQHY